VAGLSSTDKCFPLHLWDCLIPQVLLTLNLLRPSRLNPRLSAEAQLNGAFDFNRTPLAPPGTKVIVHDKPAQRGSWAPHGLEGWYLGPARDHYRCYRVYISKTGGERIANTLEFLPQHVTMPATSSADRATYTALDLIDALQHPAPAAPFATFGDAQLQALRALTAIFHLNIAKGKGPPSKHHLESQRLPVAPPRVGPTQGEPHKPTAAASVPRVLDKLTTHGPEPSRLDPPPNPTRGSPERRQT